jgi:hypothetical protein
MQQKPPQAQTAEKHPDEWQRDLNPEALAGQNIGVQGAHPEKMEGQSAFDMKEAHQLLQDLSLDDLKELRVLPTGTRLQERATYIDLKHRELGEITGTAHMEARDDTWYVPKKDVSYELWNRLLGIKNPIRTGGQPS